MSFSYDPAQVHIRHKQSLLEWSPCRLEMGLGTIINGLSPSVIAAFVKPLFIATYRILVAIETRLPTKIVKFEWAPVHSGKRPI
jgi:hypothetical protein